MSVAQNNLIRETWKDSTGGLIAVFIFGAFINLLKFAMPLYTLQILDRIPDSRSVETLFMLTLIALLAVLSGVALEAVRTRMFVRWAAWIKRRFGAYLVQAGINSAGDKNARSASDALADLNSLRRFIERGLAPLIDIIWMPLFILVVALIHPAFGVLMLAAIACRITLGVMESRLVLVPNKSTAHANEADHIVHSAERNIEAIHALNMASSLTERWQDNTNANLEERDRSQSRQVLYKGLNKALYRCLYVTGMGMGVWLVVQSSLTIGGIIAANIIMRFGYRIVDRATRRWDSFQKARIAYGRLSRQLEKVAIPKKTSMSASDLDAPLILERVSFRYPGQKDSVFRRFDLTLPKSSILSIIGPSASGKTTFSRLITGIITPKAGKVRLGNIDIHRIPADKKSGIIGYLPQEARLFTGTVRDNIARMTDGDFEQVIEAAKLAGIHDTILRLEQGYDTLIDEETPLLSGGERKRIVLARAYYGKPRLMVLDEPEANLDRASRKDLYAALQKLAQKGATIVVTTQSNRISKIADATLILGRNRPRVRTSSTDSTEKPRLSQVRSLPVEKAQ